MKKLLLILFLSCFSLFVFHFSSAQNKINFPLRKILLNSQNQNEQIHFAVKGDTEKIKSSVKKYGGNFKYSFEKSEVRSQKSEVRYSFISMPAKYIEEFSKNDFVEKIEFTGSKSILLNDSLRINMNVNAVHQGNFPLFETYDGTGVLIGIIDAGIEVKHPDFLDSFGKTRIVSIWDQTMPFNSVRTPIYGYGQVWDSTDINQQNPNLPTEQTAFYGHGSHVAAIAGGNGNSDSAKTFKGMAPNANFIVVSSDFNADDWLQTVADAVDFIFTKADEMGKPCVINISAGTYAGSHDGKDVVAKFINSKVLEKNGRAVVCAAGNAGNVPPFHLRSILFNEEKFTWFKKNNSFIVPGYSPNGGVYFELFADTADFNNINFSFGADKTTPKFELRGISSQYNIQNLFNGNYSLDANGIFSDTLKNSNGQRLAKIYFAAELINDSETYALYVLLNPDSSQYNFRFTTNGTGKFDVWSTSNGILGFSDMVYDNLPADSVFPDIVKYVLPDTNQSIVSSFSCAPNVITVGNYTNRFSFVNYFGNEIFSGHIPGSLFSSSSIGPTRDNRIKPDITAPGGFVISASDFNTLNSMVNFQNAQLAQGGLHREGSGTSFSSPAVAGLVALFFQKCFNTGFSDFYNAITQNAKTDSFTGNVPNNFWGFGKADAFQTLISTNYSASLKISDSIFCPGNVNLSVDSNFSFYLWSNGFLGKNIVANQSGNYFATVVNNKGCRGRTDTANVIINPSFSSPQIFVNGETFFCEGDSVQLFYPDTFVNWQWNNGKNTSSIFASETFFYKVTATANNGCNYFSDSVLVWAKTNPPKPEIFQNADTLISSPANNYQWYLNGNLLIDDTSQNLIVNQSGFFQVEVFHVNGCSTISDSFFVVKSSIEFSDNSQLFFVVYPNPNDGNFVVRITNQYRFTDCELIIYNILGEKIYSEKIRPVPYSSGNPPAFWRGEIRNLSPGIYIMKISNEEKSWQTKIIVH